MSFGISKHPIIPGRAEPSDKAEMVTQILFGETYRVVTVEKLWLLIENDADAYQCWIDKKQHTEISECPKSDFTSIKRCGDAIGQITNNVGKRFFIPCGSLLQSYHEGKFEINGEHFEFDGRVARHDSESIIRHARRLLHAPYLWGGKTAMGIDCSGFTQVVTACAGINIPRDAWQQAEKGEAVDFIDLTEPGDLAFFDNKEGRITHVGIVLEKGKIIHASGSVRIDTLDHEGIYNEETKLYSHKLRLIKRFTL